MCRWTTCLLTSKQGGAGASKDTSVRYNGNGNGKQRDFHEQSRLSSVSTGKYDESGVIIIILWVNEQPSAFFFF